MSYVREVRLDEDNFEPFAAVRRAFGFVPNFYRAQTLRPDVIAAETRFVESILVEAGALSRRQKEYVFLVCSAFNLSTYCVTAHCEIIRLLGISGPEPEKIALDHLRTDLPAADKALLNFALKLNREATKVGPRDLDALRAYGFDDAQILEAVLIAGLARFANLVSAGLGTDADFEPKIDLAGRASASIRTAVPSPTGGPPSPPAP